jgi:hypothetical protein
MVVEGIAEIAPLKRTKQVTRQDLKDWVKAHYAVELDDRWLDVLLREHVLALRRHIERKKAQPDTPMKEQVDVMIDEIEAAMQRHQTESN